MLTVLGCHWTSHSIIFYAVIFQVNWSVWLLFAILSLQSVASSSRPLASDSESSVPFWSLFYWLAIRLWLLTSALFWFCCLRRHWSVGCRSPLSRLSLPAVASPCWFRSSVRQLWRSSVSCSNAFMLIHLRPCHLCGLFDLVAYCAVASCIVSFLSLAIAYSGFSNLCIQQRRQ